MAQSGYVIKIREGDPLMPPQQNGEVIWVVVLVQSGVPVLVEAYFDEKNAEIREQALREDINPDYDEVGLFEVKIGEPDSF
jgi:hypothetical protein